MLYGILALFMTVALIWLAVLLREKLLASPGLTLEVYRLNAIAIAVLPLLLMEGAVALQAALAFDGLCYGLIDGFWPCSRLDYVGTQARYGLIFLGAVGAVYVPIVLAAFYFGWQKRPTKR